MPIERSRRSRPSARVVRRRNALRLSSADAAGPTPMSPRTTKPELAAARDEPPGLVGRAPALLRLARRVHLHEHRGSGRVLRDLLAELDPVDRLPQRDVRGDQSHLVRLQPADEVPSHGRSLRRVEVVGLGPQVLGVVLAEVDQPRTDGRATVSMPKPLVTATSVTVSGSPPALAMRSRSRSTRSASSVGHGRRARRPSPAARDRRGRGATSSRACAQCTRPTATARARHRTRGADLRHRRRGRARACPALVVRPHPLAEPRLQRRRGRPRRTRSTPRGCTVRRRRGRRRRLAHRVDRCADRRRRRGRATRRGRRRPRRRSRRARPARSRRSAPRALQPGIAVTAASASAPACSPGSVTTTTGRAVHLAQPRPRQVDDLAPPGLEARLGRAIARSPSATEVRR